MLLAILALLVNELGQTQLSCLNSVGLDRLAVTQAAPDPLLDTPCADEQMRRRHFLLLLSLLLGLSASTIFLLGCGRSLLLGQQALIVLVLELAEHGDELEVDLISGALRNVEREREDVKRVALNRLVILGHVEEQGELVRQVVVGLHLRVDAPLIREVLLNRRFSLFPAVFLKQLGRGVVARTYRS